MIYINQILKNTYEDWLWAKRQKLIKTLENLENGKHTTLYNPQILFEKIANCGQYYWKITSTINQELLKKIDFSNVSFDNVDISGVDFTGYKGVKINPQTVFEKDLSYCIFSGVEFIGPFDGAMIEGADFTGSKGAKINPQTVYDGNLKECKFSGVEFIGPFDGAMIEEADFTGSKGAKINPQTVYDGNLKGCKFSGVEVIDPFDGEHLSQANFTGSKVAKINFQTICWLSLYNCALSLPTCNLTDAEVVDYEPIISTPANFDSMELTRNKPKL